MSSLINHSKNPNCLYQVLPEDHFKDVIFYTSTRKILKDEEILINYVHGGDEEDIARIEKMHGFTEE